MSNHTANIFKIDDRLQKHLKNGDYSFIGPVDGNLLNTFMRRANDLAPVVGFARQFRDFLGHRQATRQALDVLPAGTPLRIYIIDNKSDALDVLFHDAVDSYCIKHNIDISKVEND